MTTNKLTLDTIIESPRLIANGRGAQTCTIKEQIHYRQSTGDTIFSELLNEIIEKQFVKDFYMEDDLEETTAFVLGFTEALYRTGGEAAFFIKHATREDLIVLFDDPNISY